MTQRSFKKLPYVGLPQASVSTPLWSPVTPVRDNKIDNPRLQPGWSSTVNVDKTEDCFQYNSEFVSSSWEQEHRKTQQTAPSTVHIFEVMKCADSCVQDSLSKHTDNSLCTSDLPESKYGNSLCPSRPAEPPDMDTQAPTADRRTLRKHKIESGHKKGQRKGRTKRKRITRFNIGGERAMYPNVADGGRNARK